MVSTLSGTSVSNGFDPAFEYEFSDGEDSKDVYREQESDEDTEDASETDAAKLEEEFTEMKEQMYKEKLASLKKQLQSLSDGSHPELNRKLKKIDQTYKERLRMAEVARCCEIEAVERDYIREKKNAVKDLEQKKIDLKENLLIELEDKRRMIEGDRLTMELTGVDPLEVKPASTRKLRRRQNEPVPLPEKRRKPSPAQFCFLLSDEDVASDMKLLNKQIKAASNKKSSATSGASKPHSTTNNNNNSSNLPGSSTTSTGSGGTNSTPTQPKYIVRIADSKLFYEKRWFHRGQNIYVDSKDTGKVSAVISSIGTNEIWVRKTTDNQKMRIYVSQMQKGKFKIRKRST